MGTEAQLGQMPHVWARHLLGGHGSQPESGRKGRPVYRMVVCQVLGKSFQIEGHLKQADAMHDVVNVRALTEDIVDDMIESCQACCVATGVGATIQSVYGDVWGRVVSDDGKAWRLHTGRIARKDTEGYKWIWADSADA